MSSRPHARATLRLRSRIQKGRQRAARILSAKDGEKTSSASNLVSLLDEQHCDWVRADENLNEDEATDSDTDIDSLSSRDQELCNILRKLSDDFQNQEKFYAAEIARVAVRLVAEKRSEDIDPSLWRYVHLVEIGKRISMRNDGER